MNLLELFSAKPMQTIPTIFENSNLLNRDCYNFFEEQDMGSHIPCCKIKDEYPLQSCEGCCNYNT